MALPDISGLIEFAPAMLRDLPQILFGLQVIFYIVMILFFGSIILKGYRGYAHFAVSFLLRLGFGFIALVCGLGLSTLIPPFSNDAFYSLIQSVLINPFIGMIISTAVLTISLYLISHNMFNISGIRKQIDRLQERLKKAEDTSAKAGGKRLEPLRIAGLVILVVLIAFSLMNFQGFRPFGDDLFSYMGITPEEIEELGRYLKGIGGGDDLPSSCVPVFTLVQENFNDFLNNRLPESTDASVKSLIEGSSGLTMAKVYHVTHEGMTFYLGLTAEKVCSSTHDEFCECMEIESVTS